MLQEILCQQRGGAEVSRRAAERADQRGRVLAERQRQPQGAKFRHQVAQRGEIAVADSGDRVPNLDQLRDLIVDDLDPLSRRRQPPLPVD